MFREVYTQPFSYIRQSPIGGIEKHVRSYIILWSYPLAFENTPKCLRNIQLRRIWRQKKEKKSSLFPYGTEFLYLLIPMYRGVVKDNKCIHFQVERYFIKETYHFVGSHLFERSETFIAVVAINHSKDIEACNSLGRDVDFLPLAVANRKGHILLYKYGSRQHNKVLYFLQMPDVQVLATSRPYIHRVAARVIPLGVFLFAYILRQC